MKEISVSGRSASQPKEKGKSNECGGGSDQQVGKISVSCSKPIPDLLERIHHRLSEDCSAMPYDSADRIAGRSRQMLGFRSNNAAMARSGVR